MRTLRSELAHVLINIWHGLVGTDLRLDNAFFGVGLIIIVLELLVGLICKLQKNEIRYNIDSRRSFGWIIFIFDCNVSRKISVWAK